MKYRIAETSEGYFVQKSLFGFKWFECFEPNYYQFSGGFWHESLSPICFRYKTYEEAENAVKRIKNPIINIKGYKIAYFIDEDTGEPYYYIQDYKYSSLIQEVANSIEKIQLLVDKKIKELQMIADKKKILHVTYIND